MAVGVVGAGVMGIGVSQALAQSGYGVVLVDLSRDALEAAMRDIRRNALARRLFSSEGSKPVIPQLGCRISTSTEYYELREVEFVIENVTEKRAVKNKLFQLLDTICSQQCVFISNTSAVPITRLAGSTGRPDRVIGVHFMNPVSAIGTVELICGALTSPDTVERTQELLRKMGKEWVRVNDRPGFVVNRVLMLAVNQAFALVREDVAEPSEIDKIFRDCLGHRFGPLETADLIGLDTVLYSLNVLEDELNDPKYQPDSLLKNMVEAGFLGRKSGKGFYEYQHSLEESQKGRL